MTCPACQLELRPGLLRCPRCGSPTNQAAGAPSAGLVLDDFDRPIEVDDRTTFRPRADAVDVPPAGLEPSAPWTEPAPAPVPVAPAPYVAPAGGFYAAPAQPMLASVGARFGAYLLDGLILMVGVIAVMLVFGLLIALLPGVGFSGGRPTGYSFLATILAFTYYAAILLVTVGYIVIGNARGQTLGKRALGIAVVDASTGAPIGMGRSVLRYLMFAVMALPCYLGYLSIPLAADHRGWHDRAADDVVITVPRG
jgi:uncharacterized RDD family membrane protein YckC